MVVVVALPVVVEETVLRTVVFTPPSPVDEKPADWSGVPVCGSVLVGRASEDSSLSDAT